ncbi:hypothetical protein EDD17DRAFT_1760855 [Pisolithus thermaeus]|nr:hypothetical protein EDD17DRAFT_1760855 [Pisolithus thermaeus]
MFPHFEDLDSIWRGNPSFDAWPFTSDQRMNCSEDMLSLVRGGVTCPGDDLFTTNSGEPAVPQDNSATGDQGISSTPWGEYDHGGMGDYDYSGMGEDDGQVGEHAGDYDFQDQAGGTSYRRDNDFGGMSYRRDDNIGGTFDDIEMYEGTENDADAASAGVQTWICFSEKLFHLACRSEPPPRPSATPSPGILTTHLNSWRLCIIGGLMRPPLVVPHLPPPSLITASHLLTPDPQKRVLRGVANQHSNKYKYAIHSKELVFRQEEAIHQQHKAKLIHRRQQESKQLNIKLMTTQTQLFEKQAEALCLQIMLAELEAKKHDGSASGGTGVSKHEAL